MRIYIAGKISDLAETEWQQNFSVARAEVLRMGYEPICPTTLPHRHGGTWLEYMAEDLAALLTCQAVYAQRNWMQSKGATIEVNLAKSLGLPVIYQPE